MTKANTNLAWVFRWEREPHLQKEPPSVAFPPRTSFQVTAQQDGTAPPRASQGKPPGAPQWRPELQVWGAISARAKAERKCLRKPSCR